jgi:hypothetical protein
MQMLFRKQPEHRSVLDKQGTLEKESDEEVEVKLRNG